MIHRSATAFSALLLLLCVTAHAQVVSGPEPGKKLAPLKVFAATGPQEGKELDSVAERGDKPTIYVLIREFDRPVGRFLKFLDNAVREESAQSHVVAAWLTDEKEETKTYLPRVQQSIKLGATSFAVSLSDKSGPNDWDMSPDARVTVVVARGGTSRARFGFRSINETDVPPVREALKKVIAEQ